MNDIIGKDGLEVVLEPYLKGTDGYKKVRMTSDGRYGDVVDVKPAKAGNYAELLDCFRRRRKIVEKTDK